MDLKADFESDDEFNINCWTVATALLTEQLGNSAASIPTSVLATKKATTVRLSGSSSSRQQEGLYKKTKKTTKL